MWPPPVEAGILSAKKQMTNVQLYLAIGIPMLFNGVLFGVLIAYLGAKFEDLHRRCDEMLDRWRAEPRRVEGITNAA